MAVRPGLFAVVMAAFLVMSPPAQAAPILGDQLLYTGGDVTIETLAVGSEYQSELGLYDSAFSRVAYLVNDEPPGVIVTFNPATFGFSIGDELMFGIRVVSDGNLEYFMGPASRNPDSVIHAGVENVAPGIFVVGFEDLFGGGDLDYDDNRFQFSGAITPTTAVPEPATVALIGLGLFPLARRYRRRSRS